jgi:VCBS repeat-containing protein/YVTN family beta-propeller protein
VVFTDADNDPLYYSGNATTSKGSVTVNQVTGAFTYTPTAAARHAAAADNATAAVKQDTFFITANDAHGNNTAARVIVQVLPANNDPVPGTPVVGTPNASTGVVTGSVKATDADNDTLKYTGPATTAKGTLAVNSTTGAFTYTPTTAARHNAAAINATTEDKRDTFDITVDDAHGAAVPITVTVAIGAPTNAPPVAGTPIVGTPYASTGELIGSTPFTDPDGDTLTYSGTATTSKGTVVVTSATGAFFYAPTATARHNAAATNATAADKQDTFTITANDGHGAAIPVTVTVSISAANSAPVPANTVVGNPNTSNGAVSGKVTVTDADNDTLKYTGPTTTAKGSLILNTATGNFTYTPTAAARQTAAAPGATAADKKDTFTITVNDAHGAAIPVTVSVPLVTPPANRAPVAGTPTVGTPNATSGVVTGALNVTDPDGNPITYTVTTAPTKGKVTVSPTGTYTFTPSQSARLVAAQSSAVVTDTFTITASDGQLSTTTTVTAVPITPGHLNASPTPITIGSANNTYIRDGVYSPDGTRAYFIGYKTDAQGAESAFVSVVDATTNTVIGDPIAVSGGRPSSVAISRDGTRLYVANDAVTRPDFAMGTGTVTVISTVTKTIIGDPIPIVAPAGVYAGGGLGNTNALAVSPDGTRVYVANSPDFGTAESTVAVINTTTRSVTGEPIFVGYGQPTMALNPDGTRLYIGSYSWAITAVNTATNAVMGSPIPTGGAVTDIAFSPDGTRAYAVIAHGTDDFYASWISVINTTTNTIVGDPIPAGDQPYRIAVSPDGGLAYVTTGGSSGTLTVIDTATKAFIGDPAPAGFYPTHVLVSPDGNRIYTFGDSFNEVSVIDFGAVPNDPPVADTTTIGAPNANTGAVSGKVNLTDADNDTLKYSGPITTSKGSLILNTNTGNFTYTPSAATRQKAALGTATAADKQDLFTITANDAHGHLVPITVRVAILPTGATPNAAPVAGFPTLTSRNPGTGVSTGSLGFYDRDGDQLSYLALTPAKGSVTINPATGTFTYTPTAAARHAAGTATATADDKADTFTVIANDSHGNITPVTVTVQIGIKNAKPVLGTTTVGTPNTTTGVVTGKITATDSDNDTITYVGPTTTAKGSVTVDRTTGAFTYTPAAAARFYAAASGATTVDKQDTFTVTAYDNHGEYVSTVVTVAVSPSNAANRPPVQTAPTTVGTPNPITGEVSGHFHLTDPDGDGISYTIAPIGGSRAEDGYFVVDDPMLTVNGTTGAWTFVPTDDRRHEAALETGGRPDSYSFHWTATDTRGATVGGDITVPITPINQQPVIGTTSQTRNSSTGVVTGTFTASDPDSDYLDAAIVSQPSTGTATVEWVGGSTYQWTYKPAAGHLTDPANLAFEIGDGHTGRASEFVSVDLQAPTSTATPVTTGLSSNRPTNTTTGAMSGTITIPNSAGRDLVFTRTGNATKGSVTVDPTTGVYTYTPTDAARQNAAAANAPAGTMTDSFVVTVKDGAQTVQVVTIKVPISPLNRRPSAVFTVQPADSEGTVHGKVTATDPDGDELTYSGSHSTRLHGTVDIGSDGSFTYTPDLAVRALAAEQGGGKDYFFVAVTEEQGRKTDFRVIVDIPPLTLTKPPTVPPRYPPPSPGGGSGGGSGGSGGGSGGGSDLPAGTPAGNILNNPHRITGPISGLQVTKVLKYKKTTAIDPTAYLEETHYAVTVTNPTSNQSTNPANNGDIYVVQIDRGVATGYTKLEPGVATTGEEVFSQGVDLYGCYRGITCMSTDKYIEIVSFAPGYFPYDLFPGGTLGGGGTPVTGPIPPDPYDGYLPEAEEGIKDKQIYDARLKCAVFVGSSLTYVYMNYPATSKDDLIAKGIEKTRVRIPGNEAEEKLKDEFKDTIVESAQQCTDAVKSVDGGD